MARSTKTQLQRCCQISRYKQELKRSLFRNALSFPGILQILRQYQSLSFVAYGSAFSPKQAAGCENLQCFPPGLIQPGPADLGPSLCMFVAADPPSRHSSFQSAPQLWTILVQLISLGQAVFMVNHSKQ